MLAERDKPGETTSVDDAMAWHGGNPSAALRRAGS